MGVDGRNVLWSEWGEIGKVLFFAGQATDLDFIPSTKEKKVL